MSFIVALTGGIGCGKTTAANFFAKLGIDVIDADQISRDLVIPDSDNFHKIVEHFGEAFCLTSGTLDRHKLAELIFNDPEARQWLENLLHPQIWQIMESKAREATSPYCIVVIPLLFETEKIPEFIQRVLVIDVDDKTQLERIEKRGQQQSALAQQILQHQVPRNIRLERADDTIDNSGEIKELEEKVSKLHQEYLLFSS